MSAAVKKSAFLFISSRDIFRPTFKCSSHPSPAPDLLAVSAKPHFLWIIEFPLFTLADPDKDFQAHGRWSATHHPFTAPVWEDLIDLKDGRVEKVSSTKCSETKFDEHVAESSPLPPFVLSRSEDSTTTSSSTEWRSEVDL